MIGAYRARIPEVAPSGPRPLWSVMIPTYNCARYLPAALNGVLEQDPGPDVMQIEVVDDHSTEEDIASLVAKIGRGRVDFYRQSRNVGVVRNLTTCVQRSRGQLIHLLHGDDCVRNGFYCRMQRAFEDRPDIGAAFCRHIFMDSDGDWLSISELEQRSSGILTNWLERLASEQRIMTPSIIVRREAYEQLGGFDERLACSEDWEMWVRIAAHYPIWYESEPLAVYRMHMDSNTGRHTRSAEDIRYTRKAIDIFKSYLPDDKAEHITRKAKRTYALSAIDNARRMRGSGEMAGMFAQLRESLRLSVSPLVLSKVAGITLFALVHMAWRHCRGTAKPWNMHSQG